MKYSREIDWANQHQKQNKKALQSLLKGNRKKMDDLFHKEHQQTFKQIDCLSCANCCKTTSPIFRTVDIKRISKRLRMSEQQFIDSYLKVDEDQDYVLKQSPCFFLQEDNTCFIYEDRPLACREYPHTDRKNMYQIMDLTLKNTEICPAVSRIVQKITKIDE